MYHWSSGDEGSDEGGTSGGQARVCEGLEGVVTELMLLVEGLLGLQSPVPPSSLQLWASLTHLLGLWALASEARTQEGSSGIA